MKNKFNLITADGKSIQKRITKILSDYANDRYLPNMDKAELETYLKNTLKRLIDNSILDFEQAEFQIR